MLSSIKTYLAKQARKPSGWIGRTIFPRIFNRDNKQMEEYGLNLMSPVAQKTILEVGFGNGQLISEIMPLIADGKVAGIDISEEMVTLAKKRHNRWIDKGKLEIKKASVTNIPYPENYFDTVFTCNTIYFWPNPKSNMQEIKRVLKPAGTLYCALRLKERMESISSVIRDNQDVFQNLYRKEEVKHLFEQAKLNNVRFHHQQHGKDEFYIISGTK